MPIESTDGMGMFMSFSRETNMLNTGRLTAAISVQARAFMPGVLSKMSMMSPEKNAMVSTHPPCRLTGSLRMR